MSSASGAGKSPTVTVATFNLSQYLPPGTNLSAALSQAARALESIFGQTPPTPPPDTTPSSKTTEYITALTDFLATRTALENTSVLLALSTFLFLAMSWGRGSWAQRFGDISRTLSPFARSPPQGSNVVSDNDFSYITSDDLRKHGADGVGRQSRADRQEEEQQGEVDMGPPRDTDALVLRNKRKEYVVHFPAYSIAKGDLTIGSVREHAAKKMGTADPRRIKLLYRGKNLKDDGRSCRAEGLRHESELLCTVAETFASGSGSDDDEDDDDEVDGDEQTGADGETRRRRNRGKKSKRKAKREQQTSGTSTPSDNTYLPPPAASSQQSRAPSPKPPPGTPLTAMDKLNGLRNTLQTFMPAVEQLKTNPPSDPAKKEFEHKKLSETILQQVLLKLDAVETEGDQDARLRRKELVRETQAVLNELDRIMGK